MSLVYVHPDTPTFGGIQFAKLVLVGEAPGEQEAKEGRPFRGKSGKLLIDTLHSIGLFREDCYITNVVKVRPPHNRRPTKAEVESWLPILAKELQPIFLKGGSGTPVVIALGKTADYALNKLLYSHHHLWHPAYALRTGKKAAYKQQFIEAIRDNVSRFLEQMKVEPAARSE